MKKVLMKDIAQKANVTLATVSYVLNNVEGQTISGETRERISRIARELGYVPNLTARALASKKSGLIGVMVVKSSTHFKPWKDFLYFKFINEIEVLLKKNGYHVLIASVDAARPEFDIILQRELDGVFLVDVCEDAFYKISNRFNVPIILIDSYLEDDYFTKIVPDFEAAIAKAKELLSNQYGFLIADKVNNMGYAEKIKELSGLSEKDILFADKEENIIEFLKERKKQKGIVINEYLAMLAARHTDHQAIAVVCTCGSSSLLPEGVKKVNFNENKPEIAVDVMLSYIGKHYSEDKNKYKLIEIKA